MLLAFSDRLKKTIFEERVVTCTLMIAAQGLLPAFVRGWGLLKQCCVRNAIPTTEPKAILLFFLRRHAPVSFLRRPSLRITGYGNFLSGLCSHSLSLRGWLQMMPVLNICSFWIHWLGSAASRDPLLFEGVPRMTALFFDDGYLTCTVQEKELLSNPGTKSFIITLTATAKEGWQWHTRNRPLQRGTSRCLVVAI